jgi:hypothetical protein
VEGGRKEASITAPQVLCDPSKKNGNPIASTPIVCDCGGNERTGRVFRRKPIYYTIDNKSQIRERNLRYV